MRRRKVTYPTAKTATRAARNNGSPTDPRGGRSTVATIDLAALLVRDDLAVGDRVRIGAEGLHAGELAVVEKLMTGVIPTATVRTAEGHTRRVRVIDLLVAPEEP